MKRISYGGGTFVTCDHVATELIDYGVALAAHNLAASVDIPVLLDDGTPSVATVLLGPASQFVIMPEDVDGDLECGGTVDSIRERREALGADEPRTATWAAEGAIDSSMIDPI